MKFCGPFKVTLEVAITDGEQVAMATISGSYGRIPNEAQLRETLTKAEAKVKESMPDFRLMTRPEFIDMLMEETCGTSEVAIAGLRREGDWDSYDEAAADGNSL